MFTQDARVIIRDMLELFSQASQIPLELYVVEDGVIRDAPIRALESQFPEYCRAVWALGGGNAKNTCNQDMCRRAQDAAISKSTRSGLCHAALDNQVDTIEVGDEVVAVLQYGAFRLIDPSMDSETVRLRTHAEAMQALGASEAEAQQIAHLLTKTHARTIDEWRVQSETLLPILKDIIVRYVGRVMEERLIEQRAYHDLQVRVQAALSHAEALADDLQDGTQVNLLDSVQDIVGAITGASLVMHSLTRGEYLPKTYRWRSHQIDWFFQQALTLCRAEMRSKQLEVKLDLQPYGGRIRIEASRRHLEQAFNNLIQNAVKYSFRSSQAASRQRYVSIRGRPVNDGYEVVIGSYGVGILPEEFDKIFVPGYRGLLTNEEYRTGSGLGLPLTKQVIEAHGGTIRVDSEAMSNPPLSGPRPYHTRFIVWLPLSHKREPLGVKGRPS